MKGMKQSPINITKECCKEVRPPPLLYQHYFDINRVTTVLNDGETLKLLMDGLSTQPPLLSGGYLSGFYELHNIHFHWGPRDNVGAEHTLNGRHFTMEMHLVHYKTTYREETELLLQKKDGIVVVAFFLQVECNPKFCGCYVENTAVISLVDAVRAVRNPGSTTELNIKTLMRLLQTKATPYGYFTYPGSLTTPNYEEVVTWIIYPSLILISHDQVEAFRQLKSMDGTNITKNYRDIQPLNERTVLHC